MLKAHRLAALAAVLFVGAVTPANAVQVTYSTSGTFGSSGTALLDQGGARIRFDPRSLTSVDDPPNTNAIFGSFTTLAAPPSPGVTLVDTFTLTITQTSPAPGGERGVHVHGRRDHLPQQQPGLHPVRRPPGAVHPLGRLPDDLPDRRGGRGEPGPPGVLRRRGPVLDAQRRDHRHPAPPSPGRWPWPASPCRCSAWGTCVVADRPRPDPSRHRAE